MQLHVRPVAAARLRHQAEPDADGNGLRAAGPEPRPATAGLGQDRAAAVSALYAEHALGLIRLAHIMLGDRATAEDVVQDAFCGLYRRWPIWPTPRRHSATSGRRC
jgi:Sigma-70 region 2